MTPGTKRPIRLTDAGRARLELATKEFLANVEQTIVDEKFIPGEDIVEATASDVDAVVRRFEFRRRTAMPMTQALLKMYALIGALLVIVGLTYPLLIDLYQRDRIRFQIIVMGFFFAHECSGTAVDPIPISHK